MDLDTARTFLENFAKVGPTQYSNDQLDYAIRTGLNWLIAETGCTRTSTNVAIASGITELDVSADITNFLPVQIRALRIGTVRVDRKSADHVRNKIETNSGTGKPEIIGFFAPDDALIYPESDAAYTLKVTHAPELTAFALGGGSVTLNIPDRWIEPALTLVCGPFLTFNAEKPPRGSILFSKAREFIATVKHQCQMDINVEVEDQVDEYQ